MFIPATRKDMAARGWDSLDIVLVSGDTYTDNSYNGTALVGHWLIDHGYRVGMVAQPDMKTGEDILRLGEPELFWSVSAGCVDSMVANYTPMRKFRKQDDFTPGGVNDRRPDRACIAYTNLIKRYAKGKPIILAGIEASLRRIAHYDYWSDSVRRSILFDSKADGIVYGMGEITNLEIAQCIRDGRDWKDLRGICWASSERPDGCIELPSYEQVSDREDRHAFMDAFRIFSRNSDPITARPLAQAHGNRFLVQNVPQRPLTQQELDAAYGSDFENAVHPFYARQGEVRAMQTVRNSITTHRGCYGECSFCAISVHQGSTVVSRSEGSILDEARRIASRPGFNGTFQDVGGPTANMYGIECPKKVSKGRCEDRRCLGSHPCPRLPIDHSEQIDLLKGITGIEGVKHVFVNSGIRYDMILADRDHGDGYLDCLVRDHVSGQMKVAPEHISDRVLDLMGKPGRDVLMDFKDRFYDSAKRCGRKEFLTYYFMAAHPGCTQRDMEELSDYCRKGLRTNPEQVQVFTPTPSTYSTAMWWCGFDMDGRRVYVDRSPRGRQMQKETVVGGHHGRRSLRDDPGGQPRPGGRGARRVHPQEELLLRVVRPERRRDHQDLRLHAGGSGQHPIRPRALHHPPRPRRGVDRAAIFPLLRRLGRLHRLQEAGLRQEEQEPHPLRQGRARLHPGFRGQAARHGAPAA